MNAIKRMTVFVLILSLLCGLLSACSSQPISNSGSDLAQAPQKQVNKNTDREGAIPEEDFDKLRDKLGVVTGFLYGDYAFEIGSTEFEMGELDSYARYDITESYLSYSYLHALDEDVWEYDYDNKTVNGSKESLNDLFRFFFGSDINDEDIKMNESLEVDDSTFVYKPRSFGYLHESYLVCSEKTKQGYRLIINSEMGGSEQEISYLDTWNIELKTDDTSVFGYSMVSANELIVDEVLESAPSCIKDNFHTMEMSLLLLSVGSNLKDKLNMKDISRKQLYSVLHAVSASGAYNNSFVLTEDQAKKVAKNYFGELVEPISPEEKSDSFTYKDGEIHFVEAFDVNYGRLYPVYVKQQDNMIFLYVNHMYEFDYQPEYEDSWEIVFEEDQESDLGCHLVSIAPIEKNDFNFNDNYMELNEGLENNKSDEDNENDYNLEDSLLESMYEFVDGGTEVHYALWDIDGDGVEECILRSHLSEFEEYSFMVLKESDNSAVLLESDLSTGRYYDTMYYSPSNQAVVVFFRTSSNINYFFYTMDGDTLTESFELCWEQDYSPDGEIVGNYYYVENGNRELIYSAPYGQESGDIAGWSDRINELVAIEFTEL